MPPTAIRAPPARRMASAAGGGQGAVVTGTGGRGRAVLAGVEGDAGGECPVFHRHHAEVLYRERGLAGYLPLSPRALHYPYRERQRGCTPGGTGLGPGPYLSTDVLPA